MNGTKIVQLIRPRITQPNYKTGGLVMNPDTYTYKENFNVLISNVDLSCCGVSYDGNKVSEDYPNAILHCRSKVFSVNQNAKMYSHKRIHHRIAKLEGRGWSIIDDTVSVNRDLKIDYLNKSI
jgi:hypothetical protein